MSLTDRGRKLSGALGRCVQEAEALAETAWAEFDRRTPEGAERASAFQLAWLNMTHQLSATRAQMDRLLASLSAERELTAPLRGRRTSLSLPEDLLSTRVRVRMVDVHTRVAVDDARWKRPVRVSLDGVAADCSSWSDALAWIAARLLASDPGPMESALGHRGFHWVVRSESRVLNAAPIGGGLYVERGSSGATNLERIGRLMRLYHRPSEALVVFVEESEDIRRVLGPGRQPRGVRP